MFKKIRIYILLLVLFFIGANAWLTSIRSTDWNAPLSVSVHPVSDGSNNKVDQYINNISVDDFKEIEVFMTEQASKFGITLNPAIYFSLDSTVNEIPPALPDNIGTLGAIVWSLKFRYWAWKMKRKNKEVGSDIHLFLVYRDPNSVSHLPHSVGLRKGMIGIVHAYADRRYNSNNRVVILHELLHTLGASDKYNLSTGYPIYPQGFAEPDKTPLYPQKYAEIMASHIPISKSESKMPNNINLVKINLDTASEIGWKHKK